MKKLLLLLFILGTISYTEVLARQNSDNPVHAPAAEKLRTLYLKNMDTQRGLYNGPEYEPYLRSIKGSPNFLDKTEWRRGNVVYDHSLFINIPLKYDLVKDQLVVLDTTTGIAFTLINERLTDFWLQDHHFKTLRVETETARKGIYDLLKEGRINLYAKRSKTIESRSTALTAFEKLFKERVSYYIEYNGNYYVINNKGSFLNFFDTKKNSVRNYLKENKLDYKTNKEAYFIKGLLLYEKLDR